MVYVHQVDKIKNVAWIFSLINLLIYLYYLFYLFLLLDNVFFNL